MKLVALTASAQAMLAAGTALQAFMLLHAADQHSFGQFALVMLWLGWCLALSAALTGASALIRRQRYASQLWQIANRRLAALLALLAVVLFHFWQLPLFATVGFAFSHFCLVSRALQRQLLHQDGASVRAAQQDWAYALLIICASLGLFITEQFSLSTLAALNALAGCCLLWWLRDSASRGSPGKRQPGLRRGWPLLYAGFRQQGAAALTGVVAIELLANGYLYLAGSWLGPAAVAPFAAILLLFRPTAVLLQGMSQRWRPDLWLLLQQGIAAGQLVQQLRPKLKAILLVLLANLVIALVLLIWLPGLLWPHGEVSQLWSLLPVAACLVLLRAVRQLWLLLLQAQNRFTDLAKAELTPALWLLPCCLWLLALQTPLIWLMIAATCAELWVSIRVYRAAMLQKKES